MTEATQSRDPFQNDALSDRAKAISARLWDLLITWCGGKAMGVVKLARKNALEACLQLNIEYEKRSGNIWMAMLRFILNPQDKWANGQGVRDPLFSSRSLPGRTSWRSTWTSSEAVSDNTPEEVNHAFAAARGHIRGYYDEGRTFALVPDVEGDVLMQVDAVRAGPQMGKVGGEAGKTGKTDKS
eukprot:5686621-Pyramimonas_sp.AAC.1